MFASSPPVSNLAMFSTVHKGVETLARSTKVHAIRRAALRIIDCGFLHLGMQPTGRQV